MIISELQQVVSQVDGIGCDRFAHTDMLIDIIPGLNAVYWIQSVERTMDRIESFKFVLIVHSFEIRGIAPVID